MEKLKIALVGNPNSGKTTLFNALTQSNQKVGNWAGVTIEKKVGYYKHKNYEIEIIDLPGIYGLSAYSKEEEVALNFLIQEPPDLILNLIDGNNFERNFYLSLQLFQLDIPCVIAINMIDELKQKQIEIDYLGLETLTKIPVMGISAIDSSFIDHFISRIIEASHQNSKPSPLLPDYGPELQEIINKMCSLINEDLHQIEPLAKLPSARFIAIKLLESDPYFMSLFPTVKYRAAINPDTDFESQLIHQLYAKIENYQKTYMGPSLKTSNPLHETLDLIFTNRWLGIPIFGTLMYIVFWLTFTVGGFFLDFIDFGFTGLLSPYLHTHLEAIGIVPWLSSLIIDGVVAGVGSVLTFLPNIIILFFAIALLEDTGYMARVAFIMDRLMSRIGLNGKAIVPMLMGFGCNAPAILSTRVLENESDRLIAILINPFMSCGARLPIYVLLTSVFFPSIGSLVTFVLYFIGILVAIFTAMLFKNTLFKSSNSPFLLELPPYRLPSAKGLLYKVYHHSAAYVERAGTIIFMASMIIWFILNFGPEGYGHLTSSYGKAIGTAIAPIFKPLGFGNWQASLSLLTGVVAKEIVISNMAIILGLADMNAIESVTTLAQGISQIFSEASSLAFMVFSLLYTPCIAVIGIIKSETQSWRWPIFSMIYSFLAAWLMGFITYQIAQNLIL